ncbi:MAG: O-antigen ligase domain-containing protein, partial [Alicyclobacillus sp.]|nr:O-antigen ligase domain-containing protein [Alicyclobacillus sp.]
MTTGQAPATPAWVRGRTGISQSRWGRICLYAWMCFPWVDFALREKGIHPLGVIWDKVVLLILVVLAGMRYMAGVRPARRVWHRYAGWFLLYGLGLMFAGLAQPLLSVQGYRIDVYYILYAFLLPFVVAPEDVPQLLHLGALTASLVALHGVLQYLLAVPIPSSWVDVHEHVRTRVFSILQSPNELGSYMALSAPLLAGLALYERDARRRWLYSLGAVLCVA